MIVATAGDWHGQRAWAAARLEDLGERGIDVVLHVGDFGLWPGPAGKVYLRTVDEVCARYGIALLVTAGNHDDWSRLTARWDNPKNRNGDGSLRPLYLTDHIAFLPRGHRWDMGGRTFVSLGGAPSVDFEFRPKGNWWPEEMMSQGDVDRTVAGGYADVFISHDAPGPPWCVPQVEEVLRTNPMGWSDRALDYATIGRERITDAFLGVAPRLLVHGHYHVHGQATIQLPGADYDTTIWALAANGQGGNIRLLDLDTLG